MQSLAQFYRHAWRRTRLILFEYPISLLELALALHGLAFGLMVALFDGNDPQFSMVADRFPLLGDGVYLGLFIMLYDLFRIGFIAHDWPAAREAAAFIGFVTWGTITGLYCVVAPTAHELPSYLVITVCNAFVFYRLAFRQEVAKRIPVNAHAATHRR